MSESTLAETLAARFPGAVRDCTIEGNETTLTVSPEHLVHVCELLRDEPETRYNLLATLTRARGDALYQLVSLPQTSRLLLRVPLGDSAMPTLDSLSFVWPAANWAEREAHDLWSLAFAGHPDLAPLLCAKGLPASKPTETSSRLRIHSGTRYPTSVDGLSIDIEIDEQQRVSHARVNLGYRHSGLEARLAEWPYARGVLLAARMDGFAAMSCDLAYALAVEKLLHVEPPLRAQVLRTIFAELQRIASHLFWLARCVQNLTDPAFAGPAYAWQGRAAILDLFQELGGNPITPDVIAIGGLKSDLFSDGVGKVHLLLAELEGVLDDLDRLLTHSPGFRAQLGGVGVVDPGTALGLGVTGPCLRACGVAYDVRIAFPYAGYVLLAPPVPTEQDGDADARYRVRIAEMRNSLYLLDQALSHLEEGPVNAFDSDQVPPTLPPGTAYASVEGPRGELGVLLVSDGGTRLQRVHIRGPSFANLSAMPFLVRGARQHQVVGVLDSLDISMAEVER
jgi:NADH:ubiquinone oxidoreductase subunit D/NADH:ubiquinone oxidoreductase subunit C